MIIITITVAVRDNLSIYGRAYIHEEKHKNYPADLQAERKSECSAALQLRMIVHKAGGTRTA